MFGLISILLPSCLSLTCSDCFSPGYWHCFWTASVCVCFSMDFQFSSLCGIYIPLWIKYQWIIASDYYTARSCILVLSTSELCEIILPHSPSQLVIAWLMKDFLQMIWLCVAFGSEVWTVTHWLTGSTRNIEMTLMGGALGGLLGPNAVFWYSAVHKHTNAHMHKSLDHASEFEWSLFSSVLIQEEPHRSPQWNYSQQLPSFPFENWTMHFL